MTDPRRRILTSPARAVPINQTSATGNRVHQHNEHLCGGKMWGVEMTGMGGGEDGADAGSEVLRRPGSDRGGNPNVQIPNPNQIPIPNDQGFGRSTDYSKHRSLGFGHWGLIGIWDLVIGHSRPGPIRVFGVPQTRRPRHLLSSIIHPRTLFVLIALLTLPGFAQIDPGQFKTDTDYLASLPSRSPGTDGYFKAADYVQKQIDGLPNVQWRKHEYPVMVPITESATITVAGNRVENVYPFWPDGIRVSGTPPDGVTGKLVYCKDAELKDVKPALLDGQIAVLESTSGGNWSIAVNLGARAILILGTPDTSNADLRAHDFPIPVNVPRFYVPPGALADALRAGTITGDATIKSSVTWKPVMACNYYALVKSPNAPTDWPGTPPAALAITVPFDSGCLVPDLDPGASLAVQTASGLGMLRDLSQHPLARPVLICFTGADSIAFLGSRNMHMALSDVPSNWTKELTDLSTKESDAKDQLDRLRQLLDSPQNLNLTRDRPLIDRLVKNVEIQTMFVQDKLFDLRALPDERVTPAIKQQRMDMEARQSLLSRLQFAFGERPADLSDPQIADDAKSTCRNCLASLNGSADGKTQGLIQDYDDRAKELQQRIDLYHWLANAEGRNPDPDAGASNVRLLELLVGLDLTDRNQQVAPIFMGRFAQSSTIAEIQEYTEWFSSLKSPMPGKVVPDWFKPIAGALDLEPLNNALTPTSWTPASQSIPSEMGQAWGVPSLSFITVDDLRLHRDTPADTLDKITFPIILKQLDAVSTLLWHWADDRKFKGPVDPKWRRTTITGQVVSAAPGKPVPDLPRAGFLATYFHVNNDVNHIPSVRYLPYTIGNRRNEVHRCDADGNYRFEGMWKLNNDHQCVAINAFQVQPGTGAVTGCTDLGQQAGDIKLYANFHDRDVDPMRSLVFNCQEFSLTGLYDPRYLQDLSDILPLDARRNADPQKYNILISRQMMAGYVEPNTPLFLLLRYGRVGNRLILVNMPKVTTADVSSSAGADELGRGFTPQQLTNIGLLPLVTSRDFWNIDDLRLAKYAKAGVTSDLVNDLHKRAGDQIEDAKRLAATPTFDGQAVVTNANGAWANEARVYMAAQDMANDVIHAAIFLLLLCVPFSFCMERLIIGTPNVYKQIAGIGAIFGIMTMALWGFHPAFKISSSPLIIILAFGIIFMSVVVINVVYGKFDTELKRIRSGRGAVEGASIARASVLMSAVLLGIANMRKRKFRTVLTSITIVLITFAVLCFTSASRYLDTSTLPTGVQSRYAGLLLRQRGFRPMTGQMLMNVRAALDDLYRRQGKTDRPVVVERWWNANPYDPQEQIHLIAGDKNLAVPAMLGLSPGESQLSPIGQVIGQEKFDRLEKDPFAKIIYLSSVIADELGVKEGDTVTVGGIGLTVAGVFDADEFDQKVTMLSGEGLSPLKYVRDALDAGGRKLQDAGADDVSLDSESGGEELNNSYDHLPATQFAIVPAWISKLLPNQRLTTLGVKLAPDLDSGDLQVKYVSDDLAKRFSIAIFAGFKDGVQMVVASNLASVSGAGQVAIPLAIAGLIIFNTMMGSIAERRREIHVYTSLGLAPMHVGALFVAEAMTYGLIGTVFGYVIGQGVGTILLKLGWLGNTTLNYSGTSAMLTMGLILIIVLLSALVPARLASKIAAPSIERSWKVPLPKNDEILAVLPFTINKTAAEGVLAYLSDFLDAHKEGSIGKFSAGNVDTFSIPDEQGRISRGLKTTIWLTPFDLGVRQHLMLLVHPGQYQDIYEVQVLLSRLSGDDGSWYRMNRTFLTELRKQFLQWRSLSPQRMLEYIEISRKLFVPAEPVTAPVLSPDVSIVPV
jgi:ABC-type lipoprotein release transport system permease subunit